ncbi:MAG: PfkB family carbohydrate kinase [Chloroflexota bacterium]
MSLLVVGTVALDSVETPFGKVEEALGGTASYFAFAARHYTDVKIVAVVGEDFPRGYRELFESHNIDVAGLQTLPGRTFRWAGHYDFDLNTAHTLDTQLNVLLDFHPLLPDDYRASELVFLGNIDPILQRDVLAQASSPKLTVLDSMNFWIERKREDLTRVISMVDVVLLNEAEVRQYAQSYNLLAAARTILDLGPKAIIIKKGEYGALMISEEGEIFIAPAYPLESVKDPTGAGDSFAGGFLGYLASTGDFSASGIRKAMIHGSVIASFTVEDFGVNRLVSATWKEIEARYQEFQRLTFFEHSCRHADDCQRLEYSWAGKP